MCQNAALCGNGLSVFRKIPTEIVTCVFFFNTEPKIQRIVFLAKKCSM